MPHVAAILAGAGSGERLGQHSPKAFVEVGGAPLLVHAVQAFARAETVDDILVVVGQDHIDRAGAILRDAGLVAAVCPGGASRVESVGSGLERCPPRDEVVAVHDVARAFVSPGLVDRTVRALVDPWTAVAPAIPVVDTLKAVEGEQVVRTVERAPLRAVQTPQVFRRPTLERAHEHPDPGATDDLALVERAGGRVRLIEGERRNFKLTYPEDLVMAAALIAG